MLDYEKYKPFLKAAYALNVLLLLVLLVAGKTTRGILGWYTLGSGSSARGFQPSEICKITLILILSKVGAQAYDTHGKKVSLPLGNLSFQNHHEKSPRRRLSLQIHP